MSPLARYPACSSALLVFVGLLAFFWAAGTLDPQAIPHYATSRREVIGMALMLMLLPPYFVATTIAMRRHSLSLVEALRPWVADPRDCDRAWQAVASGWRQGWLPGAVLGFAMGLLNTSIIDALTATVAPRIHLSLSLGQLFLWTTIGVVLGIRFVAARAFRRLGEVVSFELFRLDRLKPLARSGLVDMMVIAGALAFAPLQSLDAEFRWYNYSFGLAVASLASLALVVWPLWPIHGRIRADRRRRLDSLDALIAEQPAPTTRPEILALEPILSHRDRLASLRPWLVSTDLVSRFLLYLIFPPLAWAGAAIVERIVDQLLSR